jgi:predicted acylesterase/phospholipase RssA
MKGRSIPNSKRALVLAGGGLAGTVYELGALRAINDLLVGMSVNDFDIYVGTSAGAVVAAGLANGFTPTELLQSIEGTHETLPPIRRRDLFRFNTSATLGRLVDMPLALFNSARHYYNHPKDLNLFDLFWELSNTLPSALYDGAALDEYLRLLLAHPGATNHFEELQKELYIVATSLENGQRAVFGEGLHSKVPISLAVTASSAVPILYKPVRIGDDEYLDGGVRGNASLDIAIEHGAKLVVCINPMVPVDNMTRFWHNKTALLSDQGMQVVFDQVFRILLHSGLHYHLKQLRRRHPDVDIILIEPRADDFQMMFSNIMRYSTRLAIARHGYESVTVDLAEEYSHFKSVLARHGVQIDRKHAVLPRLEKLRDSGNADAAVAEALDVAGSGQPAEGIIQAVWRTLEKRLPFF